MAVHSMRDSGTMETPTSTAECRHGVISAATVLFPTKKNQKPSWSSYFLAGRDGLSPQVK